MTMGRQTMPINPKDIVWDEGDIEWDEGSTVAPNSIAKDPMNATPEEAKKTEKARRNFVKNTGTRTERVKEFFRSPNIEYADSLTDYATRIIPKDAANLVYNMVNAPKEVMKKVQEAKEEPVVDADPSLMGGVKQFATEGGGAAWEAARDLATPVGGRGLEAFKDAWMLNPVQSAAVVAPVAAGAVKVARGAKAPLKGRITPEVARLAQTAEDAGVPLSPADITRSKPLAQIERGFDMIPTSTGQVQRFREGQLGAYTDNMLKPGLEKYGAEGATALEVGEKGIASLEGKSKAFYNKAEELYGNVEKVIPADARIMDATLQKTAKRFLSKLKNVPDSMKDSKAVSILSDLAEGNVPKEVAAKIQLLDQYGNPIEMPKPKSGGYDWRTLQAMRSQLNELIATNDAAIKGGTQVKGLGTKEGGIYKQLRRALDEDLNAFAATSELPVKEAVTLATQFYKEGKQTFASPVVRRIIRNNPEMLTDIVFRPNAATDILTVKKAVDPQTFNSLRGKWLEGLLKTKEDKVFPSSLANSLKKYDEGTLKAIFKPDELREIRDIANIGQMLQGAEKLAGNPSGTAGNVFAPFYWMSVGGMALRGNIPGALGALGAPPILAKMYLSKAGRNYLLKGFNIRKDTPQASKWVQGLSAFADKKVKDQRGSLSTAPITKEAPYVQNQKGYAENAQGYATHGQEGLLADAGALVDIPIGAPKPPSLTVQLRGLQDTLRAARTPEAQRAALADLDAFIAELESHTAKGVNAP
jgi:hypothetical protein